MNDNIIKRRLIGLAALLFLAFALSWLLPRNWPESGEKGVPSVTLPLSPNSPAASTEPAAAPPAAEAAPAISAPAPAVAAAPSPAAAAAEPAPPGPMHLKMTESLIQMNPAPPAKPAAAVPSPPPPVAMAKPVPAFPAPSPAPAAGEARQWYVQIGSFADQNNAQTTLSLLQNIGYHGESTRITSAAGANLYRVRLGPFADEATARLAFEKVVHQGYPQARVLADTQAH